MKNKNIDYNKLAHKLITRRTKPYPVNEYHYKSHKYKYVYNVSIDGVRFWHAKLGLYGITYPEDYYTNDEEDAALWVYKQIKKYLNQLKRDNKRHDNKKWRKHLNWQTWLLVYQHHQYPKKICELILL